jgi:hypothetical protein
LHASSLTEFCDSFVNFLLHTISYPSLINQVGIVDYDCQLELLGFWSPSSIFSTRRIKFSKSQTPEGWCMFLLFKMYSHGMLHEFVCCSHELSWATDIKFDHYGLLILRLDAWLSRLKLRDWLNCGCLTSEDTTRYLTHSAFSNTHWELISQKFPLDLAFSSKDTKKCYFRSSSSTRVITMLCFFIKSCK